LKSLLPEQHFTEPPPRFNEASLVKELEERGIGRPSTYATILSTIQERQYAQKIGGKFVPTEIGLVVTDLLVENFKDIFDFQYTARLEEELDEIEEGKQTGNEALSDFMQSSPRISDTPRNTWKTSSVWRSRQTKNASSVARRW